MIRFLSLQKSFIFSAFLYLVGMGGDSYYQVFGHLHGISNFYKVGFILFDYTRNGLFFTPIFFILGAIIYQKCQKKQNVFLLLCSLIALLMESFLLHYFTKVRHDSMYLTLPIVMYFLFQFLLNWQPPFKFSHTKERALGSCLLHPFVIAVIYFVRKVIPIFSNSMINFLFVLLGTICLANFLLVLKKNFKPTTKTFFASRATKII